MSSAGRAVAVIVSILTSIACGPEAKVHHPEPSHGRHLVIASCFIAADGTTEDCRIIESQAPGMNDEVLRSLSGLHGTPVMRDGKAVREPYTFRILLAAPANGAPDSVPPNADSDAGASGSSPVE